MNIRTGALGAVMAILIPWMSVAAELTPRQVKKNLKQANKSWKSGQIEQATKLYEGVLSSTVAGASERPEALYALGLVALTPDSKHYDLGRAKALLTELDGLSLGGGRGLETQILLNSLENRNTAAAMKKAVTEAEQREAAKLQELEKVRDQEHQKAETRVAELEANLKRAEERLATRAGASAEGCDDIKQKLKKAEEAIQELLKGG